MTYRLVWGKQKRMDDFLSPEYRKRAKTQRSNYTSAPVRARQTHATTPLGVTKPERGARGHDGTTQHHTIRFVLHKPSLHGLTSGVIAKASSFKTRVQTVLSPVSRRIAAMQFWQIPVVHKSLQWLSQWLPSRRKHPNLSRLGWGFVALLMLSTVFIDTVNLRSQDISYALTPAAEELLPQTNPQYAGQLSYSSKTGSFEYNKGYTPGGAGALSSGRPRFIASIAADIKSGGSLVTDPVNDISLKLTPQFTSRRGRQVNNRLIYPLVGRDAQKVYTLGATGVKEDIILNKPQGNDASFSYKVELPKGTEAKMLPNGNLAVYGVDSALLGNVSTGSEKDAKILESARTNGQKTNLVFTLPAPYVKESGVNGASQTVQTHFGYKNGILTVYATNMQSARYPLTIDPTIYITTAANLMQGNNETNVEFDATVGDGIIKKGKTTGARINAWTPSLGMPTATWDAGSVTSNGYMYNIGGSNNGTAGKYVYNAAGARTFTVPAGVSSITVKAWGGGGGSGAGSGGSAAGGNGGGAGYVTGVLSVTAGTVLNVNIGSGGAAGSAANNAGDGGGASSIINGGTVLLVAPGGGGGGGSQGSTAGGAGGVGGTINASNVRVNGTAGTNASGFGGGFGTASGGAGGAGGTGGAAGAAGAALLGGDGGGAMSACNTTTTTQGTGSGTGGGGAGGNIAASCVGGGGGGSGYFGGGGGGSGSNAANRGGGGGGGGAGYSIAGTTSTGGNAGSGTTPGNSADTDLVLPNSGGTGGTGGTGNATAGANTAGKNGIVVISYTMSAGSSATSKVYWAQFNSSTDVVQSPTPGSDGVACTSWCNNSAYNLPAARRGLTTVAYNGFIYALGGFDDGGTPAKTSTVYIAKLGANGEPQKWHPTGGTAAYWFQSSVTLPDTMAYSAAVAYNNGLYIFGGQTGTTAGGDARIWRADILPTGDIGSWSLSAQSIPTGALSAGRYGHGVQVYNDTLYLVGGRDTGNNFRSDVWYSKLDSSTGTLGAWTQTNGITGGTTTGRMSMGGNMTAIWGGYIYLSGGCAAVNGSGYCTTYASEVRLASINADGSLGQWGTIANITNQMVGGSTLTWQGALYRVGGCVTQNTTTGACDNMLSATDYGTINPDGDASTVSNSAAANTGTCSGSTPYNCDLPAAGTGSQQGGQMSSMTVINNGYIYNIGGCTVAACTTMSPNTSYAVLNSDGTMGKPATCPSGAYVTNSLWCVDNAHTLNGANGLGAAGATVFNNTIYIIGGTNGTTWQSRIFRTAIASNGSIGAWSSQTFSAVGMGSGGSNVSTTTARGYLYTFTRANPASAGTNPGNLYILGGCNGSGGIGCTTTTYLTENIKCNIATAGTLNGCTTVGQLQIDADTVNSGSQGLGLMAGTVYANRLYLVGGACQQVGSAGDPCGSRYSGNRKDTMYAKIDSSNNIVNNSTGLATGNWSFATAQMSPVRRRAISFGYNGYIYSLAGYSGAASLQDLLFAKINVSTGNLDSATWSSSGVVVTPRWDLRAIVSNGYVYAIGGCATGAAPTCSTLQPQIQTFQLYNNDSGAAASYSSGTDAGATGQRIGGSATILNGYIYYAGGCTNIGCTTFSSEVDYAPIDAYGTVGTWHDAPFGSLGANMPASVTWGKLVSVGSTLYYVGGQTGNATTTATATIYYASSFNTGAPVSWTSVTTNGAIGDTAGQAAQARTQAGVAVWNNRIYVVGGYSSAGAVTNTVYYSPDLSGGGASLTTDSWMSSSNTLAVARAGATLIAYANNLYILGGFDGTNYLMDTAYASLGYKTGTITQSGTTTITGSSTNWTSPQISSGMTLLYASNGSASDGTTATIQSVTDTTHVVVNVSRTLTAGSTYMIIDGSVGAWTPSTSLPGPLRDADGFASNGYIYLTGGRSAATTCTPSTLVTPVSANTTITSGNNATGIGEWYETNQRYANDRYGAGVAYASGRTYVMGGGCSALVANGTDWMDYATLNSQPQIARYTKMIDADKDVFASMWLANGVDNSTGARWSLKYRSMNDPLQTNPTYQCGGSSMTAWGSETNFGPIQLAKPGVYTPKNGGGANISCSRFYYLSFAIDASQAFGYPEPSNTGSDIRGPYISDISLYYASTGAGRLLHGKSFTGGLQQPLDTPCRQSNNSSDPNYAACPLP